MIKKSWDTIVYRFGISWRIMTRKRLPQQFQRSLLRLRDPYGEIVYHVPDMIAYTYASNSFSAIIDFTRPSCSDTCVPTYICHTYCDIHEVPRMIKINDKSPLNGGTEVKPTQNYCTYISCTSTFIVTNFGIEYSNLFYCCNTSVVRFFFSFLVLIVLTIKMIWRDDLRQTNYRYNKLKKACN